jgi:hypothetical protein
MLLIAKISNTASLRRGKLHALLAVSMFFMFMLAACRVAVSDDGVIAVEPISSTVASVR